MNNPILKSDLFDRDDAPHRRSMTVNGTVARAGVLLAVLLLGAVVGWSQVEPAGPNGFDLPLEIWFALGGAFVAAMVCSFVPKASPLLSVTYAALEGAFLGALSHRLELQTEGIVLQAMLATLAAFAVTLLLFVVDAIKVTERVRSVVVSATCAVVVLYLVGAALTLVGVDAQFWSTGSPLGVVISLGVIVIACLNLFLDYDFVRQSSLSGAPKHMEWYAAFGLMLTLVWVYLEILRFLLEAMGDDDGGD